MNKLRLGLLLATVSLFALGPLQAKKPSNVSVGELAMVPEFCAYTMGFNLSKSPQRKHWEDKIGPSFSALHHYCWAKINMNRWRLQGGRGKFRDEHLRTFVEDLEYALRHSGTDSPLLPEIRTSLVEAELLRDNAREAVLHLQEALRLKDDYVRPYYVWGEYLLTTKQTAAARDFLRTGLEKVGPDSRLQEMFLAVGGDPKSVARRQRPATSSEAVASTPDASASAAPAASAASR